MRQTPVILTKVLHQSLTLTDFDTGWNLDLQACCVVQMRQMTRKKLDLALLGPREGLPGVAQQLQSWTKMSFSQLLSARRIRWVPAKHHEAHRFQLEDLNMWILQLQFSKRPKLGGPSPMILMPQDQLMGWL